MWYAASEIIFFLVLAAVIGGLVGYGTAQIYQIDFGALREARATSSGSDEELASAHVEIADLRRRLQIATDALRGDDAPAIVVEPPLIAPSTDEPIDDAPTGFPPVPSTGHEEIAPVTDGRRLSERVADAERG